MFFQDADAELIGGTSKQSVKLKASDIYSDDSGSDSEDNKSQGKFVYLFFVGTFYLLSFSQTLVSSVLYILSEFQEGFNTVFRLTIVGKT